MSPIAPFYSDWLFKNLSKETSVHLTYFPPADPSQMDTDLEASMEMAQQICSLAHGLRKTHKLKVRQPLAQVLIPVLQLQVRKQIQRVESLILSEINVKELHYLDSASGVLSKTVKPNFKTLGPKYGPKMKEVAALIQGLNASDLEVLEAEGQLSLGEFQLDKEDVELRTEDMPGYLCASENGLTIALDHRLNEALVQEGRAREFVNKIQNLRKDLGMEVTDKIHLSLSCADPEYVLSIQAHAAYIQQEVQALSLDIVSQLEQGLAMELDGTPLQVWMRK